MAAVINVTSTDTQPTAIQYKENNAAKDITGYSIVCRIGTDPVTQRTVTIVNATTGECTVLLGSLPAGTYSAIFRTTVDTLVQDSDPFTVNVRQAI